MGSALAGRMAASESYRPLALHCHHLCGHSRHRTGQWWRRLPLGALVGQVTSRLARYSLSQGTVPFLYTCADDLVPLQMTWCAA